MSLVVRQADLSVDRRLIIQFLFLHLTKESDDRRFDWLYLNNPHGPAVTFIAEESGRQEIVGLAAAFPRRMSIGGRVLPTWVLGDFGIDPRYRTLGPALQLQRACLEVADVQEGFCYDFPSQSMMAVYSRLRIRPFASLVRMAKPLRANRKLGEWIRVPLVPSLLAAAANELLKLMDPCPSPPAGVSLGLQVEPCGEEFDVLANRMAGHKGRFIERSARYLNWRYLSHPIIKHEMLTARRRDRLEGYLVFSQQGEDAALADWFGSEDPAILTALISGAVSLLRARRVSTLSAPMLDRHPWKPLLVQLGFRPREFATMVVHGWHASADVGECDRWFIMQGDRDS